MKSTPALQDILKIFERDPGRDFRLREIVGELGLHSSQAAGVKHLLKGLVRKKRLVYLTKNTFALAGKSKTPAVKSVPSGKASDPKLAKSRGPNIVAGRLISHRDGYGFVVPDAPMKGAQQDIFIPPDAMSSAMNGDKVEVQVLRPKGDGRMEGRIVVVVGRSQKTVVGEFHCGQRYNFVTAFDQRIPFEIVIPQGEESPRDKTPGGHKSRDRQFGGESEGRGNSKAEARSARSLDGMVVDVEITSYPRPASPPRGRIVEVLGKCDDFGVDVEIIIRKFHLPHRFPVEVLAEAEAAPQFIRDADRQHRRDFRALPIVTIDGETAKDFDDAVLVERSENGNYLLHVHIADVAHYVRQGMALDHEARLRGTSVYFPDRAVPMLPLELSNGICSLNPHVERLVMSALMEFDAHGAMVACELTPGILRSAERMTYTAVRDILAGKPDAVERYAALVPNFKLMEELFQILNSRRLARGSIDFDLPEPLIEFDASGRMVGITRSERHVAHRLIEEFMLAANQAVAGFLENHGIPSLYRIHEQPDARKVIEFEEIAAKFGYSLGVELPASVRHRTNQRDERDRHARFAERMNSEDLKITPRHYQRLTQRLAGKPEERILSYLMLRSLKQARYSPDNSGHFALAAESYTHFTSPIRRYPDLIVHRVLKAALEREGGHALVVTAEAGRAASRKLGPEAIAKRRKPDATSVHKPLPPVGPGTGKLIPGGTFMTPQELDALGIATSESERRAADAERELMEWKKVAFMAQHVGDEFDALIISLIKFGFFVELTDLFVEGFVPLSSLDDDYYVYRERQRAIVGDHSHRAFHLGARLRVRLVRIDRSGNKLEFNVVEPR